MYNPDVLDELVLGSGYFAPFDWNEFDKPNLW